MLSPEIKQMIEEELAHAETKPVACLEAMKIVQKHQGYVSDESLEDLSEMLDMSVDELDSVATFYSLIFRRPVGEHVILLCDSVSCWIMGYENLKDHLERKLGVKMGGTTADGKYTLLTIPCLGACDRAPAMMVDDELHGPLDAEKIDAILEDEDEDET